MSQSNDHPHPPQGYFGSREEPRLPSFVENWLEWIEDCDRGTGLLLRSWPREDRALVIRLAASALGRRTASESLPGDWHEIVVRNEHAFASLPDDRLARAATLIERLAQELTERLEDPSLADSTDRVLSALDDLDAALLADESVRCWQENDIGISDILEHGGDSQAQAGQPIQPASRLVGLAMWAAFNAPLLAGAESWFAERVECLSDEALIFAHRPRHELSPAQVALLEASRWILAAGSAYEDEAVEDAAVEDEAVEDEAGHPPRAAVLDLVDFPIDPNSELREIVARIGPERVAALTPRHPADVILGVFARSLRLAAAHEAPMARPAQTIEWTALQGHRAIVWMLSPITQDDHITLMAFDERGSLCKELDGQELEWLGLRVPIANGSAAIPLALLPTLSSDATFGGSEMVRVGTQRWHLSDDRGPAEMWS